MPTKILAFAGSARKDSFNKKLIKIATHAARNQGADVTLIDLADFPMPLYDGDTEATTGLPENAHKLKALFLDHNALMIASPEYNSSLSPLLINVIAWVSRPVKDQPPLNGFTNKIAALLSASPGALGGLRGLAILRSLLSNINVTVLPSQFTLPKAPDAFDPDGFLKDPKQLASVESLTKKLIDMTSKIHI